jgi:hypothetical protein
MDPNRMANRSGSHYIHKVFEVEGQRDRDRHLAHLRTLDDQRAAMRAGPDTGLLERVTRVLLRRPRLVLPTAQDAYRLTDVVCDLASGAKGRVGVRRTDEGWVADCVAPGVSVGVGP